MDELSSTFAWGSVSEDFALFRTLSSGQRLKAFGAMVRRDLVRGQMLVAQGEPSDALFVVLHGALKEWFDARNLSALVSVTDETDYAASFCVVEIKNATRA